MSALFQPYTLKNVTLRNRIAVPPMCQYITRAWPVAAPGW
jgi:2,4-dienoyl-CoA reductase-like NADH-dependent reductase (Old Yellow Enzyme family)